MTRNLAQNLKQAIGPIRTKRTFEEVSNNIKELIFAGVLKPGDKLPSESAMADMLQVGRQSVREALRLLELSGFIKVERGVKGGPIIQNTMLIRLADMYLDAFRFNRISWDDFMAARAEIEKSVLTFALENIQESDLVLLHENIILAKQKQAAGSIAYEENIEFHRLLAKASRNHVFIIVMESILAVMSDFRSRSHSINLEKSIRVTNDHERILDAVAAGQKERALELMQKHLMLPRGVSEPPYPVADMPE